MTHCLRIALRKRYASRRRRTYTTGYTRPQGCHVLYWKRIRKEDIKINKTKTQEHLVTTQAHRRVPWKPVVPTLTTEYLPYLNLQSNNGTRIAETHSKSWFSCSWVTWKRSLSCSTWIRNEEINEFREVAEVDCRYEQYGDLRAFLYCFLEAILRLCIILGDWRTTTMTPYQCQALSSKRTPCALPNMYFQIGNECAATLRKCCKKLVSPSMVNVTSYLWDDTKTTNTDLFATHRWIQEQIIEHDKIALEDHSNVATKPERIQNTKHWVLRLNQDGAQQPLNQRHDFAQAKR